MIKKILLNFLIIAFIIALILTKFNNFIKFNGVLPDFFLILTVFNGIFNGPIFGMIFGFASGLALDISEYYPLLGFFAFVYTVIGYLTSTTKILNIDNSFISTVIILAFIIIKSLLCLTIGFFFLGKDYIIYYFKNTFLIEAIYTMMLSIPVFVIYKRLFYNNPRKSKLNV